MLSVPKICGNSFSPVSSIYRVSMAEYSNGPMLAAALSRTPSTYTILPICAIMTEKLQNLCFLSPFIDFIVVYIRFIEISDIENELNPALIIWQPALSEYCMQLIQYASLYIQHRYGRMSLQHLISFVGSHGDPKLLSLRCPKRNHKFITFLLPVSLF